MTTSRLRDSNPPRPITFLKHMLYALLRNTYRWFFLLMREAQFLFEAYKNRPSFLGKQYREDADALKSICSDLHAKIDPEESERYKKLASML